MANISNKYFPSPSPKVTMATYSENCAGERDYPEGSRAIGHRDRIDSDTQELKAL